MLRKGKRSLYAGKHFYAFGMSEPAKMNSRHHNNVNHYRLSNHGRVMVLWRFHGITSKTKLPISVLCRCVLLPCVNNSLVTWERLSTCQHCSNSWGTSWWQTATWKSGIADFRWRLPKFLHPCLSTPQSVPVARIMGPGRQLDRYTT